MTYNCDTLNSSKYKNGYLKIVVGCMFSGKTSYIIKERLAWESIGKKVLMINYILDTRYGKPNAVTSHDQNGTECIMASSLSDGVITAKLDEYDVIIVDEAHFFEDLLTNVTLWCDTMKKIVVVAGLDGDYKRHVFGEINKLISHCDEYVKLNAYCTKCKDGNIALFTWKIANVSNEQNIIDIGGTDKYVPLCRMHYNMASK